MRLMADIIKVGKIFKSYPIDSILLLPNSPHFTIADVNTICLKNTLSKEEDWIGKNIFEAFPVNPAQPYIEDKSALKISLETVLKTKQAHKINAQRYFRPNDETGVSDERFAEIENIPILNDKNEVEFILQTIIDFTENKYLIELETLEREILEMNASGKRNIKEVFKSYLFGIEQLHPGMICSILQVSNNRVYELASPSLPHEYLEMISGLEIGENEGSCGTAAYTKETVIVSDIDTDFRWLKYRGIADQFKLKACWSTPIIDSNGNVIATFANYYREHKLPNTREENTIKRAGHLIQIIFETYLKNKQIKESEKKFRTLVHNMDVGVLLQGANAEIILSNPKALELLGLTEDQLLGKTSFDSNWNVIHEDGSEFPGAIHPVPQAIATKKSVNKVVMGVYRPKTKDRVWLLVDAEPELNEEGDIVNVVCTFIDITERKLAEEEIKKSKKTYRGVLNSISELIYIQDENGCFLDVNDAVVSKYGYPKEYFIGNTPEFLSAPGKNNFDRIIEAIANAWKGSKENFEFWGVTKDGRIFPKEVNLSLGSYFGKQAIIAVGRDISETKAFEETLTNTNSILNATIESTNNGILVVNSEGSIIKRNEKFSELWQIPEVILSTNDDTKLLTFILHQLTQPEDFLAKVNDLYAKPFAESLDEIYFKDGRIFKRISKPMYIDAEPKGRVWSFEDITENKYAVDELNKSEKKYRQLIESTNEGIVVAQGSHLKFVNSVVLKLMGRTEDELMKVPFLDYVYKEDRMLVRKNYLKRIAEDNTISKFQYRIIAKDSSIRWIEMSGIVINWNGQPAALNFMTDITENFEYLNAIEEQKQKLSEIAWTQSHMVRAPLARMMGLINLLNYENKLDENTRQLLKHILDSAHEFDTIIKSIVQNTQQKSH